MAMSRKNMLRRWMFEWDLTYSDFAERLGMSVSGAFHLLNRESIPRERHAALLALGVPEALLPPVTEKKVRKAIFPCDQPSGVESASHAILAENVAS